MSALDDLLGKWADVLAEDPEARVSSVERDNMNVADR
jgi:hypothetical protein